MVKLVWTHMSSHRKSCKCYNTFVVVVGRDLGEVVGFDFDTEGGEGGGPGTVGDETKDGDT